MAGVYINTSCGNAHSHGTNAERYCPVMSSLLAGGDIKCVMNDTPATMLQRLHASRLSPYTPVVPLAEKKVSNKASNTAV